MFLILYSKDLIEYDKKKKKINSHVTLNELLSNEALKNKFNFFWKNFHFSSTSAKGEDCFAALAMTSGFRIADCFGACGSSDDGRAGDCFAALAMTRGFRIVDCFAACGSSQ